MSEWAKPDVMNQGDDQDETEVDQVTEGVNMSARRGYAPSNANVSTGSHGPPT